MNKYCGFCGKKMIWKEDTKAFECSDYRKDRNNHGFVLFSK